MFRTAAAVLAAVCAVCAGSAYAMQWHEEPSFVGDWELWLGKSDLDDGPGVLAQTYDDWRAHNSSNATLAVGCVEGRQWVALDITQENEIIQDSTVPVSYRFDKNPAVDREWGVSPGKSSIIIHYGNAAAFPRRMGMADELYVRAYPSGLPQKDDRFLLFGVREVVYQVLRLCPD